LPDRYFNKSGRQSANGGWISIGFADFVKLVNPYLRLLANPPLVTLRLHGSSTIRESGFALPRLCWITHCWLYDFPYIPH
jgi:hypothetical protein